MLETSGLKFIAATEIQDKSRLGLDLSTVNQRSARPVFKVRDRAGTVSTSETETET